MSLDTDAFAHRVLIAMDCDFPFGANSPDAGERTVCISTAVMWSDIEALRTAARADVGTVADCHWTVALRYIDRLKVPAVKTWASRWLAYCCTSGARPVRHVGEAGKACRKVELALARLGVVDPLGFEERVDAAAKAPSKTRAARRRQQRGGDCGGLKEYNERMAAPWVG